MSGERRDDGRIDGSPEARPTGQRDDAASLEPDVVRLDRARRERKRREIAALAAETEAPPTNHRQNWIALGFLAVLCLLGFWLYRELSSSLRVEQCVEAGFRNCDTRTR